MPIFKVHAQVTIGISAQIEADTPEDAVTKAEDLMMPDLCIGCSKTHDPEEGCWDVDALDGEAVEVYVDGQGD